MFCSACRNEDDGCQFVEAAVKGCALSIRSCTTRTHVGTKYLVKSNQQRNDTAGKNKWLRYLSNRKLVMNQTE